MNKKLKNIAKLTSGLYAQPDITPNVLYLQAVHYNEFGLLDPSLKPKLQVNKQTEPHLLNEGDVLFAAKGTNNFAVVYSEKSGRAVASSSFIVIRLNPDNRDVLLPEFLAWFLSHTPAIRSLHQKQLGTTIPSISIKMLKELEISIPAIEKQQLFTRIQNLRDKEKELLRKLDTAKEQEIQKILLSTLNE